MQNLTSQQLTQESSKQTAQLDAELLLAFALNCSREHLISRPEQSVSPSTARRFRRLVKQRAQGVPLAYLTGHKEFSGLDFIVNKDVLIPRPETETLVELALNQMQNAECRMQNMVLIDVGTGSGCIAISVMKNIQTFKHLNIQAFATDISRRALRVAKKNARKHGVDITFLQGNLLAPFIKSAASRKPKTELIITANLPYLTESQYQSSPSIQHEPKIALVAKHNGLALYEQLLTQLLPLISNFQFPISCFFEIDPAQSKRITTLIHKYLPPANIEIKPDLAGWERVAVINVTHDS